MPKLTAPPKLLALLTDFGDRDTYVGVMKGVLLKVAPDMQIVDLSRGVSAHDVQAGAFQLMTAVAYFPSGTLFLGVVDPGVGSARRIIYAEVEGHRFLAPDNGLLSWIFQKRAPSIILEMNQEPMNLERVSRTFHGRDIFAPLAGQILNGLDPRTMGRPITDAVEIPFPALVKTGSKWSAEIIYVDGFGNCVTNIPSEELLPLSLPSTVWFEWGLDQQTLRGLAHSYSDLEKGKLGAIAGSHGFIEIALRDGNASLAAHLTSGSPVAVHFRV